MRFVWLLFCPLLTLFDKPPAMEFAHPHYGYCARPALCEWRFIIRAWSHFFWMARNSRFIKFRDRGKPAGPGGHIRIGAAKNGTWPWARRKNSIAASPTIPERAAG